jgi:hypothetical protein
MKVQDYVKPNEIQALCEKINMPDEATEGILACVNRFDYEAVSPYFSGLFSLETGQEAANGLIKACESADKWMLLTAQLAAALHTKEIYESKKIPASVYTDSVKAFSRFVRDHKESFGVYGFDRGWWMHRCLCGALLRLGALEFETRLNKAALSVHIPSDAVMSRETLDDSYNRARRFFSNGDMDCHSWLLSPALKECLPSGSKILLFQSDYTVTEWDKENKDFILWLYNRPYENYTDLPEDTRLQRAVKDRLLKNQPIGSAFGTLTAKHP